ncbi:MAG: anaerobic ribonucleoside-triphosphate reductase activating protein [Bacteroides sp.]|nr:anaerobic ribonucleoside-triphosphate reductase activating protein [Bacteroides sp.]MCM1378716.1 anaerobic ribonucleoside-triphosphate reductase activating protein [Bacteroides sp.]MCM1444989.1 anaerobic ribonucleoside-triphosphate reductase activating protein [Prevotella sp.]
MSHKLRVLQIAPGTSVDGPGLRTSIYFAGCSHHCPECHNQISWDFNGGEEMEVKTLAEIVIAHGFNVTLTGGDPLQTPNPEALLELIRLLKDAGLTIWCYTGYKFEELQQLPKLKPIIDELEAIVDGPFLISQRDISLRFRGSRNQRILNPDGSPFNLE